MNVSTLQALARRTLKNKTAVVRKNSRAAPPARKAQAREILANLNLREKNLAASIAGAAWDWRKLLKAARFVVDVNGDSPSIPQLAEIVEAGEWVEAWREELEDIRREKSKFRGVAWSCKWEICTVGKLPGLGPIVTIEFSADSLDELAAKIRERHPD